MKWVKLKIARWIIRNSDDAPEALVEWAYKVYRDNPED